MGDSHPFDWPATLVAALPTIRPSVVPGHGGLLAPSDVEESRQMMERIAGLIEEVMQEGRPAADAAGASPLPEIEFRKALARAAA